MIDVDIEYFKKYVNSANEEFESVQRTKVQTLGVILLLPTFGILLSLLLLSSVSQGVVFFVIMVGGIVCVIASDKWFNGNRGYLFLSCLTLTCIGVTFFLMGVFAVYGVSSVIIVVFIAIHAVFAIFVLNSIVRRISNRQLPKYSGKKVVRNYWIGVLGASCGVALSHATEGFGDDFRRLLLAICLMPVTILPWFGARRLFQLYYAIKYDIGVVNARDAQKVCYGQSEGYKCPLFDKIVEGNLCIKINYENEKMLKQDKLKAAKKALSMTSEEIKIICINCKYYPFQDTCPLQ